MADNVQNWDATFHKTVRSKDRKLVGNVDGVAESSVFVSTEGARTRYKIPKHIVEGFDGHEVLLKVPHLELERFKGGADEGFREVK